MTFLKLKAVWKNSTLTLAMEHAAGLDGSQLHSNRGGPRWLPRWRLEC